MRRFGWLVLLLAAGACTENVTAPGVCPTFCPSGSISIHDTIFAAIIGRDSSFSGYLQGYQSTLMAAADSPGVIDSRPFFTSQTMIRRIKRAVDTTTVVCNNVSHVNGYGEAGNDTIDLSGVTDGTIIEEIHGGAGNDTIKAGNGDIQIFGDDGNDTLYGYNGAGPTGTQTLDGGAGDDTINAQKAATAVMQGRTGADHLIGGAHKASFRRASTLFAWTAPAMCCSCRRTRRCSFI